MARIAQVANFVGPHSGGIRTVLAKLAEGYAEAGHQVLQIVPGPQTQRTRQPWGTRLVLAGHSLPGTGYRLLSPRPVERALGRWCPDRLEVHDRSTLRGLGSWARTHGVRSCVVSHERLDRLLGQWTQGHGPTDRVADASNRRLASMYDSVLCTTSWAAEEFVRLGIPNLAVVPLGVDSRRFTPSAVDADLRARLAPGGELLLAMAIRLSPEKRPVVGVDAVGELVRRGRPVRFVVAGDGPLRPRLVRAAEGLPVEFLGHVGEVETLAALLATADVVLAPGPVETFGLAAMEALASGTPVVVNETSALPSVVGDAGLAAAATGPAFADAVEQLLTRPTALRTATARARALRFNWAATVAGFLGVHRLDVHRVDDIGSAVA
jgi:alpha-1,6-mannosyltransferase